MDDFARPSRPSDVFGSGAATSIDRPGGSMRGRDGNIHRGRPREGYYAMISHLGAMIPVVAGGLMARRLRGETGVVGATCLGDGGTSTGAFHEGLNVAAVERLPLVLVVANNQYAYSTPNDRQFACKDLLDKAAGAELRASPDGTTWAIVWVAGFAVGAARRRRPAVVVGICCAWSDGGTTTPLMSIPD
jgi:pyruvate dehydrogenase E1 component alpha subunit/2-oxoisovalerate dehydrogenase E1 component alpha subunit